MDFGHAFTVLRELGEGKGGEAIPFAALTAIHVTHRIGALVVCVAIGWLAVRLWTTGEAQARRWGTTLAAIAMWQVASGLSNVVLGWPILAALAHTAGAAVLVAVLTVVLARARQAAASEPAAQHPAARPATAT